MHINYTRCGQTCVSRFRDLFAIIQLCSTLKLRKLTDTRDPKFITIFHKTRNQVNNSISTDANSYCSRHTEPEFSLAQLTGARDEITNLSIYAVQKPSSDTRSHALQTHQSCMKKKEENKTAATKKDIYLTKHYVRVKSRKFVAFVA